MGKMLHINCDAGVEKFNEMKLLRKHAYIVVVISSGKCIVDKEIKLQKFLNQKYRLIKNKMDHIVAYLFRNSINNNGINEYNNMDTTIYSQMILSYFHFEGEYENYVKEMTKDILHNYKNLCCWAILYWNDKFCFISWVPDFAKAQSKMKHCTVTEQFKSQCIGLCGSYHATDTGELNEEGIRQKMRQRL